jgi:hypothetical protein
MKEKYVYRHAPLPLPLALNRIILSIAIEKYLNILLYRMILTTPLLTGQTRWSTQLRMGWKV